MAKLYYDKIEIYKDGSIIVDGVKEEGEIKSIDLNYSVGPYAVQFTKYVEPHVVIGDCIAQYTVKYFRRVDK